MCDTFCIRRPDGTLFAKSSDRPPDEAQVVEWFGRRPGGGTVQATHVALADDGAVAVLGSRPTWMWGLEHGVNEHRVAIGNEKVWTVDDPRAVPPALLGMDLVRLALERAATADAAVDVITGLLDQHGQGGTGEEGRDEPYWSSFLVADPSGGWVVETSASTWVAQPVDDGAAISNRLTLSTGWTRSSPDVAPGSDWDRWRAPGAPTGIADHRLAATRSCIAMGAEAGPRQAVAALRDHGTGPWGAPGADGTDSVPNRSRSSAEGPPAVPDGVGDDWAGVTVCMHVRDLSCTTASMVADLPADPDRPVRIWAALGSPCTGIYLPVGVLGAEEAVVPAVLGDTRTWWSFRRLAEAAEGPGDEGRAALAAARAALAPIEDDAWDESEHLWSTRAGAAAWRRAAAGWDARVRDALAAASG